MKVAELTGESLDWWVAQAEGMLRLIQGSRTEKLGGYSPSTKWLHGGPIIENMKISLFVHAVKGWQARIYPNGVHIPFEGYDHSPLVAAMRAYVASKFGDEVPDEVL